jgi:hypothetical protein
LSDPQGINETVLLKGIPELGEAEIARIHAHTPSASSIPLKLWRFYQFAAAIAFYQAPSVVH